jgi:hypothetical protein
MNFSKVNFLAILVATIIYMVLGALWYGPLFSEPWMELIGMTAEQAQQGSSPVIYLIPFVGALIGFYVLALFINATNMGTLSGGAMVGLLAGIGFLATFAGVNYVFSMRPLQLFLIDIGYPVVSLVIAGAILGKWR